MKTEDPLLVAWAKTLRWQRNAPAIFDTDRRVLCRFGEIEALSRMCIFAEFTGQPARFSLSRSAIIPIGRLCCSLVCGGESSFCRSSEQ